MNLIPLKYKPAIGFVLRFLFVYGVMILLYKKYLSFYPNNLDIVTVTLTKLVAKGTDGLGYITVLRDYAPLQLWGVELNGNRVSTMVEGCNAINVVILFLAFIVAFAGSPRNTIVYGALGTLVLLMMNYVRVVFLTILYYEFPRYSKQFHDILFPMIIYGVLFALWIFWVNKYANKNAR